MKSLAEWNTPTVSSLGPASVLGRLIAILDAVKATGGSLTVSELAVRTGMPKSTVSRLVTGLIDQRYLARTEQGIVLGLRLFELGARATLPRRLIAAAVPVMRELGARTGERVGLWVHHGTQMVSLATLTGRLPMLPTQAGVRCPALTTASGKAYLAFCTDQRVVDRVSASLDDGGADRFRAELRRVRSTVIATDTGESYPGILAVACPVLSPARGVMGALSIAGPSATMDPERVAPLLRAAGVTVTRRLAAA